MSDCWQGSVFAEFKTIEDAKKFLALDPKPTFHGTETVAMTK
jgi:lupus La protein